MTASDKYDCIVVGAGVMGMATASYLTQYLKKKTLLIDQWPLFHSRGSSAGYSRIFRRTYDEPVYVPLVTVSERRWKEMEIQTKRKLFHRTGIVVSGKEVHVQTLAKVMDQQGNEYEMLTWNQLQNRFPQFANFPKNERFLFDAFAAVIDVQEAMNAFRKIITDNGGEIQTQHRVTSLQSSKEGVTVRTDKTVFHSKAVVLTIGPWIRDFLLQDGVDIPLEVLKVAVFYFKTKAKDGDFTFDHHPCNTRYFDENDESNLIYSIPEFEYPGYVKFGHHHGVKTETNTKDLTPFDEKLSTQIKEFVKPSFPWLQSDRAITEYCMYTMTPDENFVIDRHPLMKNVAIGAGFSGHGFKMAPVIGQMLAELALGIPPSFDNTHFRINRFSKMSKL